LNSEQQVLLERVRNGNNLIMKEYLKPGDLPKWIDAAHEKLYILCLNLVATGYTECLYEFEEKPDCNQPFTCVACPRGWID